MSESKRMKVMTIVGTRPEIIKLSRVIHELDRYTDHVLVHSGQNFDYELNEIFFRELEIRRPDHFLEAAGATAAETIGNVIARADRVIEAENRLEGQQIRFPRTLRNPHNVWLLRNPLRPSWGEAYTEIVARMRLAIADAAATAAGHEAVIVSHQLPIWMARCDVEGRRLVHDPRRRECALASVTSLTLIDGRVTSVVYSEPAAALIAAKGSKKFVAGA